MSRNARSNLEIFKFGVYVFIPIGCFWYFNLPSFRDDYVKEEKERVFYQDVSDKKPPLSLEEAKEMKQRILEQYRQNSTAKGTSAKEQ